TGADRPASGGRARIGRRAEDGRGPGHPGVDWPSVGPATLSKIRVPKPRLRSRTMSENQPTVGTARVKRGMAEMLKGGVIMDVVTPDQAKIAEDAGAVAVMALERVPADIRAQGGVSRMSDPDMIDGIIEA